MSASRRAWAPLLRLWSFEDPHLYNLDVTLIILPLVQPASCFSAVFSFISGFCTFGLHSTTDCSAEQVMAFH